MSGNTIKRLRFTSDDDTFLLREIVSSNPFQNPEKWKEIEEAIEKITGKNFTKRALKDHFHRLLLIWRKKDKTTKIRSGMEEIYSEKDHLLQEIDDLSKNVDPGLMSRKRKVLTKEEVCKKEGKQMRDDIAMEFSITENEEDPDELDQDEIDDIPQVIEFTPNEAFPDTLNDVSNVRVNEPSTSQAQAKPRRHKNILGPLRKRNNRVNHLKKNALEYLNEKSEKEIKLRTKELEFEERKLSLAERKLALEEKRLDMEIEQRKDDRKMFNTILEEQFKVIQILSKKIECFGTMN